MGTGREGGERGGGVVEVGVVEGEEVHQRGVGVAGEVALVAEGERGVDVDEQEEGPVGESFGGGLRGDRGGDEVGLPVGGGVVDEVGDGGEGEGGMAVLGRCGLQMERREGVFADEVVLDRVLAGADGCVSR